VTTFGTSFLAIAQLFVLITLGWVMAHPFKRLIGSPKDEFWLMLAQLVYRIGVPALVIDMLAKFEWRSEHKWFILGCIVLAIVTLVCTLGIVAPWRFPNPQKATMAGIAGSPNCVFLGLPLIDTVLGNTGMPLAILFGVIAFPVITAGGAAVLSRLDQDGGKSLRKIVRRIALDPVVWGSVVGIVLSFNSIILPEVVGKPLKWLGSIASPLALLIIGARIGFNSLGSMRGAVALVSVIKLGVAPVLALVVAHLLGIEGVARTVFVLLAATPVAATTILLVGEYRGDNQLTANAITVTTVLSLVTLSVAAWMLG